MEGSVDKDKVNVVEDKMCDKKKNTRETGAYYERIAIDYLEGQGYRLLQQNYRCALGEIDIIARDGMYLVFVEVKYRKNVGYGGSWAAVDHRKQRKISRVAGWYMTEHRISDNVPCRFDVVGIDPAGIRICRNAFDYVW